jgi:hypothetical protein
MRSDFYLLSTAGKTFSNGLNLIYPAVTLIILMSVCAQSVNNLDRIREFSYFSRVRTVITRCVGNSVNVRLVTKLRSKIPRR